MSLSFALYLFLYLLFCHELVVRVLRKRIMLRFLLFIPALTYAVLNYYVLILSYILALIASSLLDDIL